MTNSTGGVVKHVPGLKTNDLEYIQNTMLPLHTCVTSELDSYPHLQKETRFWEDNIEQFE